MSESENLILEDDRFRIRIAQPDGLLFVGGLANSYCVEYSNEINFENVITEEELKQIIRAFNDQIQSYWPCTACYVFGIGAACCTLGISLFVPNMCISEAEKAGKKCLHTYSLKREYYDSKIQFALVKTWRCSSYIEMSFPISLLHPNPTHLQELGINGRVGMRSSSSSSSSSGELGSIAVVTSVPGTGTGGGGGGTSTGKQADRMKSS